MFGKLTAIEIEDLLQQQIYGHLGCHDQDMVYVVPLSYAYHNGVLYGHSRKGMKTTMMAKNPEVCFQVDQLENMGNWKSVIVWGRYEELSKPEERKQAFEILLQRHAPHISSQTMEIGHEWPFTSEHLEAVGGIVFRIVLTEKTGRFERAISPAYYAG